MLLVVYNQCSICYQHKVQGLGNNHKICKHDVSCRGPTHNCPSYIKVKGLQDDVDPRLKHPCVQQRLDDGSF